VVLSNGGTFNKGSTTSLSFIFSTGGINPIKACPSGAGDFTVLTYAIISG
jgi:hypothetical protein